MKVTRILVLASLVAGSAQASSDAAWQAQDKQQREACLALSHLQNKKVLGSPENPAQVLPEPNKRYRGDYEHLARVDEWAVAEDEEPWTVVS